MDPAAVPWAQMGRKPLARSSSEIVRASEHVWPVDCLESGSELVDVRSRARISERQIDENAK